MIKMTKEILTQEQKQEIIKEILEYGFIGSSQNLVIYTDGTTALIDENSTLRAEFDGEIERLGSINLQPHFWGEGFANWGLDVYDYGPEELEEEFKEELVEGLMRELEELEEQHRHKEEIEKEMKESAILKEIEES